MVGPRESSRDVFTGRFGTFFTIIGTICYVWGDCETTFVIIRAIGNNEARESQVMSTKHRRKRRKP